MKVNKFDDTLLNTISNYDVIGIDESQLFNDDIVKFVLHIVDILNKKVIMCGLNSDFKREKFGYILDFDFVLFFYNRFVVFIIYLR